MSTATYIRTGYISDIHTPRQRPAVPVVDGDAGTGGVNIGEVGAEYLAVGCGALVDEGE